jgi:hypothetical protein
MDLDFLKVMLCIGALIELEKEQSSLELPQCLIRTQRKFKARDLIESTSTGTWNKHEKLSKKGAPIDELQLH